MVSNSGKYAQGKNTKFGIIAVPVEQKLQVEKESCQKLF